MDDPNAQVGWTEAQWNRVREEVLLAWQRVRVAGSFLFAYGPLPAGTQVVPSEVLQSDGTVDDQATANLLEISLPVTLTRQQIREENLSSALLQFRRRATQLGQLEDWYIFNGTYPRQGPQTTDTDGSEEKAGPSSRQFLPEVSFVENLIPRDWPLVKGAVEPIANHDIQVRGLLQRNPGALGLIEGASAEVRPQGGSDEQRHVQPTGPGPDNKALVDVVVKAIETLEEHGYVAPYVCVFGRRPFEAAHEPFTNSIAFPRDRLEPLIGRELLHASAIDVLPRPIAGYPQPHAEEWRNRGALLSLAGDAVDLAIAAEATPEFRQVNLEGRYVFSVFERFTLRIKDPEAVARLKFQSSQG